MIEFETDRERAIWLASMIDGEGCISISHWRRKRVNGDFTDSFEIRIRINNTTRAICEAARIAANAGYVGARKPWSGARAHHKQLFAWQISNRRAAEVLRAIRPFLVAKQEQADLALQFQELLDAATETHRQAGLGWRYGFAPHSEDEIAMRRWFQEKMKALNFRGLPRPAGETVGVG